jgi:transcriptional regulator with XRE-family HTH domain
MRDQEVAKRIAERLTHLAEARGLSQRALAKRAGLPPEVVSRAVRGQHTPSVATLERLCDGLGINLSTFFSDALPATVAEDAPGRGADPARRFGQLVEGLTPRSQAQVLKGVESIVRAVQSNDRSRTRR